MIHNRAILPAILRTAIFLYLFCQVLASFAIIGLFWLTDGLSPGGTPSPPYSWLWFVVFGFLAFSSAILDQGILFRAVFGKWRFFFLFLAMANATICSIPMSHINKFYMDWQPLLLFGVPFLMNTLVLFVVLSRRLYAYIYPPKQ